MRTRIHAGTAGIRTLGVLTGVAAIALGATACGGGGSNAPGVATLGTTGTTARTSASSSGTGDPLKYSQCMRAHGIHDFPDPGSGGRIALQAGAGSDLDPQSPAFQAAQKACESLRPQPSAAQQQQAAAEALQFAQCMRAHGIADFPDPTVSGGRISLRIKGGTNLDPQSPLFQSAQQACQHFLPGKVQGGLSTSGGPGGGGGTGGSGAFAGAGG